MAVDSGGRTHTEPLFFFYFWLLMTFSVLLCGLYLIYLRGTQSRNYFSVKKTDSMLAIRLREQVVAEIVFKCCRKNRTPSEMTQREWSWPSLSLYCFSFQPSLNSTRHSGILSNENTAGDTAPLPETPLIVNYGCKPSPCSSLFWVALLVCGHRCQVARLHREKKKSQ